MVNLHLCIGCGLRVVNGRSWPDSLSGSFTYFSPRGSSVVDYAISSIDLMDYIKYFCVGDITTHSDHCPLSINLTLNTNSLYKLNIKSMELLTNIEDYQDSETSLEFESNQFVSKASTFDLQKAFDEPSFVYKMNQLTHKANTLPADKCAEEFMLMLSNILQSLPRNLLKQEKNITLFLTINGLIVNINI